jgi:hypothetical protein
MFVSQCLEIVQDWEKTFARLASGFVFLLANPKFYSHLASWQVVIRTPESHKDPMVRKETKSL